ncbi:hypothetical protein [Paenibacillus alvei]
MIIISCGMCLMLDCRSNEAKSHSFLTEKQEIPLHELTEQLQMGWTAVF